MRTAESLFCSLCLVLLVGVSANSQRTKSTLLPVSEISRAIQQCSRPGPEKYSDTWQPSELEIQEMESRFEQIKKLTVKECCIQGARIEDPERYYMQYVGIIINKQRLIYINAFAASTPYEGWKENAINICDGGTAWGVLYDPKSKEFHDLAINGVG